MNELTRTMSSREIATLTGKSHKHILTDIRSMFEQLKLNSADFSAQYKSKDGRTLKEYLLPFHELHVLLTGYSIPLRSKVLKRWEELESGKAIPTISQNSYLQLKQENDFLRAEKQFLLEKFYPRGGKGEISKFNEKKRDYSRRGAWVTVAKKEPTLGEYIQMYFEGFEEFLNSKLLRQGI